MRVVACTFLLFFAGGITLNPAMAEDAMTTASMAKAKFGNFPVLPKCAMISVASGDPSQGAAMVMAKASSGCVIPWHWHTAREQLMFVTGTAKVEMKDGAPAHLHSGDASGPRPSKWVDDGLAALRELLDAPLHDGERFLGRVLLAVLHR